jgi:hypothetical protein
MMLRVIMVPHFTDMALHALVEAVLIPPVGGSAKGNLSVVRCRHFNKNDYLKPLRNLHFVFIPVLNVNIALRTREM